MGTEGFRQQKIMVFQNWSSFVHGKKKHIFFFLNIKNAQGRK